MISWQSIMSVFNTKGTLLKWLKTLDQSLKDGVLQSVSVNPVSTGVITLTFNFADGSTVTTPQITLPAGEQGPQGVPGTDGTDGTDGTNGRDALVQNRALSSANITSPMAVPIEALNRTAVVGEPIVMFATDTTENKTYMLIGTVTNVGSPGVNPYVFVTYSNKVDITGMPGPAGTPGAEGPQGPQGDPGRGYLFYANITNIGKVPATGDGFSTSSSFFNRTPIVNDRFIGVFKYGVQSFIGSCRVDVAGHAVISLVVETTGAPGSGGGSGIYRHYITDAEGSTATIFTNNADVLTEWPTDDAGIIVVSLGHVENSDGLGNLLFLNTGDPSMPNYVYTTEDGSVRSAHFTEVASDEVTVV